MDATTKKSLWNHAGTAGILLGLISTASMSAGQFFSTLNMSAILNSLLGLVLWAAETGGCIYLMYLYMKKFSTACPSADNSATFRMGMATAFLSAWYTLQPHLPIWLTYRLTSLQNNIRS